MDKDTVKALVFEKPWKPVELVISSGDRIKVEHPEAIWFGPTVIVVENSNRAVHNIDPADIVMVRKSLKTGNGFKAKRGG